MIHIKHPSIEQLPALARKFQDLGFKLVATKGSAEVIEQSGCTVQRVNKVKEGQPHIVDMIKNGEVHLIINTTEGARSIKDSFSIRKEANNNNVCLTTTISGAKAFCKAILFIDNLKDESTSAAMFLLNKVKSDTVAAVIRNAAFAKYCQFYPSQKWNLVSYALRSSDMALQSLAALEIH